MKRMLSVLLIVALLCTAISLCACAAETDPKPTNVILMIGDGMGYNHLQLAKQERGIRLFMEEECDVRGWSITRSHNKEITDSAAGGTALATGVRTNNSYVAVFHYDPLGWFTVPRTLCETAKLSGRRSGVITSDLIDGATPASFTAHTSDRSNSADITRQQAKSDFDLIWGGVTTTYSASLAAKNGFVTITTAEEMEALQPGSKSIAQFDPNALWRTRTPDDSESPTLSQMTAKAISLLDNDAGFFLMVEGANIDKWSHTSNDESNYAYKVENAAEAVIEFDNAVRTAVDFARRDGNTLVVITADHETGGIVLKDGIYAYTSSSHTAADVPLIVFGSKSFVGKDEHIENRQVAQRISAYLGQDCTLPRAECGKLFWLIDEIRNWFKK